MEIDDVYETLLLEIRNNDDRQVSFSSVSLKTGETYFKGLTTAEPWLTGIEAVYHNVLLLHRYQSGNSPVHKGIIAIGAATGKTLWENFNFASDHLSVNGPVLYDTRVQPPRLFFVDIQTGNLTARYSHQVLNEQKNNIIFPRIVAPGFLSSQLLGAGPFGNVVHYLDYNNFVIVSLHTLSDGAIKQFLYIFEGFNKLYEDLLNDNVQKLQPESFILYKNRLVYIKNKSELTVLTL